MDDEKPSKSGTYINVPWWLAAGMVFGGPLVGGVASTQAGSAGEYLMEKHLESDGHPPLERRVSLLEQSNESRLLILIELDDDVENLKRNILILCSALKVECE